ncbi:MAG: STAS domain-containing protein [Bacteroidales bacterium]
MLTINLFPHSDYLLIMTHGRLDAMGTATFDAKIENAHERFPFWVLDCEKLLFISSAGIRSLLQAVKKLHAVDGELMLLNPGDQILQVIDMSGLSHQFIICRDIADAEERIKQHLERKQRPGYFHIGNRQYLLKVFHDKKSELTVWQKAGGSNDPLLVSNLELGVAIGKGCMAENRKQSEGMMGRFISFPGFFFFSPDKVGLPSDFFTGRPDAAQGYYISDACSVKGEAAFQIDITISSETPLNLIAAELSQVIGESQGKMPGLLHFIMLVEGEQIIQACYTNEEMLMFNPGAAPFWDNQGQQSDFFLLSAGIKGNNEVLSAEFKEPDALIPALKNMVSADNTLIDGDQLLSGKLRCWVWLPERTVFAANTRLEIVYEDDLEKPEVWELIIREIYKDAGKVVLTQLHGGFSAKTFQVASFNKEGKRTIPTVLKLGKVAVVDREEKNYRDYVEKYILNNSTTIMGAHYYGEWGGLRYNFLGINGPETSLKWLTHVYKERQTEDLIPLYDRIFKTVLKPWYGQPRLENIKLWESHSPLVPFFPNLVQDAEKVLGISADEEKIDCPELGRKILNPYWFLKHEWPKRINESRLWYSSVCHGDLNMQNILLDETDNIYVIDFSETHPRNIVSDFARLEPIFKIEMTRNNRESDLRDKLLMEEALVGITRLTDKPAYQYQGDDPMMKKAFEMVLKMREYARMTLIFEEDLLPYWLAVLEWTLPYASYWSVPQQMQKHAAYSSGLILEKIIKK